MALNWRALLNLGLMGLCLLLAGGGGWLTWLWLSEPGLVAAATPGGVPPAASLAQAGGRDPFLPPGGTATLARPEEAWQLLGVAIDGDQALALVSVGGGVRKMRVGDRLGGYVLREIRADSLLFQASSAGGTKEVRLKKSALAAPARPPRAGPVHGR